MPNCRKCNAHFPNRIEISPNTFIHAQNRKYCLDCSPYGAHNTAKLHDRTPSIIPGLSPMHGKEIKCSSCGRIYIYDRTKGHRVTICNSCNANQQRRKRKRAALEYKEGKCQKCGYCKCDRALGFHHKDRAEKELQISYMMSMAWERVIVELGKCDLLCANCHMEEEDSIVNGG